MYFFGFMIGISCLRFENKYSTDDDGDGFSEYDGDCDDSDPNVYQDLCTDDDDDGLSEYDGDCDDTNPFIYIGIAYNEPFPLCMQDVDGDGFGDKYTQTDVIHSGSDCDDLNLNVHPNAEEICDGIDNNCDADIDNEPVDGTIMYLDIDNDGYGDPNVFDIFCDINQPNYVVNDDDCNDFDPSTIYDMDCDGFLGSLECNDFDATDIRSKDDCDLDGIPSSIDCDDNNPNSTSMENDADCDGILQGTDCDDNYPLDATYSHDCDQDSYGKDEDCDDFDPYSTTRSQDGDCDNVFTEYDCDDTTSILGAISWDNDCDGVLSYEDCNDSVNTMPLFDADCDGVPTTEDCDDTDNLQPNQDTDCDGVLTENDCDDNDATKPSEDADCDGVLTTEDCDDSDATTINDMDCDGVVATEDCNDLNPELQYSSTDLDCDGVPTDEDCDDSNANATTTEDDADCDGVPTDEDCDDSDAATITDMDCDGVPTNEDCDDYNALVWDGTNDGDCDGVPTLEDCDDSNPNIYYQVERKNMLYYVSPEWEFTKVLNNQNILLYEQSTSSSSFYLSTYLFTEYNFDSNSNPIGKTIYTMTYHGEESNYSFNESNYLVLQSSRGHSNHPYYSYIPETERTITYEYNNNIYPVEVEILADNYQYELIQTRVNNTMERIFSIDTATIGSEEVTDFTPLTYSINRVKNGVQTLQREVNSLGQTESELLFGYGLQENTYSQGNLSSTSLNLEDGTEISFSYVYDANNNLIQKTVEDSWLNSNASCQGSSQYCSNNQNIDPTATWTYQYDNQQRVESIDYNANFLPSEVPHHKDYFSPDYSINNSYDAFGNLLSQTVFVDQFGSGTFSRLSKRTYSNVSQDFDIIQWKEELPHISVVDDGTWDEEISCYTDTTQMVSQSTFRFGRYLGSTIICSNHQNTETTLHRGSDLPYRIDDFIYPFPYNDIIYLTQSMWVPPYLPSNKFFIYDAQGRIEQSIRDDDRDGSIDSVSKFEYDSNDQITVHWSDINGDYKFDIVDYYIYDTLGHLIQHQRDLGIDGMIDEDISLTITRDSNANITNIDFDIDSDGSIEMSDHLLHIYDLNGTLLETQADLNGDGNYATLYTYENTCSSFP